MFSLSSITKTGNPIFLSCVCLIICNFVGFLPLVFNSTKEIMPSGSRMIRSGYPVSVML